MASEWRQLARRSHICDFFAGDFLYRIELQEEYADGQFWVRLAGVMTVTHFAADNLDAAKAEALRLVREKAVALVDAIPEPPTAASRQE